MAPLAIAIARVDQPGLAVLTSAWMTCRNVAFQLRIGSPAKAAFHGLAAATTNNVTVTLTSTVTNAICGISYTAMRTWLATDACGNSSTCSQTVTVQDTTPPVLACVADKTVSCTTPWTFDVPHATDNCLGSAVVYDNRVNDLLTRFVTGADEAGNEIIVAATNAYLQAFSFEYWGTNTSGAGNPPFGGAVQVRLRMYANDGPLYSGYPTPGTLLYDSGNFAVGPTPRATVVYDEMDLWINGLVPLAGPVPTNFTWTVQFSGLGPNDQVGLDLYYPPVVGQSYGDYWIKTGGNWELRDGNTL